MVAERQANGRFALGWRGGPGRPARAVERQYQAVLVGCVPIVKWEQIVQRAVDDAIAGDHQARSWLAKYLVGEESIGLAVLTEELREELEKLREDR